MALAIPLIWLCRHRPQLGVSSSALTLFCTTPLTTFSQLTASDVNFAVVRPLVFKYARLKNPAIVYVCLVVRSHFILVAEQDLAFSGVSFSRAILCEILAMKLVHHFASNQIELVSVLTTSWSPLAGATNDVIEDVKNLLGNNEDHGVVLQSALEVSHLPHPRFFPICSVFHPRWRSRQAPKDLSLLQSSSLS